MSFIDNIDIKFWDDYGYYKLPGFFGKNDVDSLVEFTEKAWLNRNPNIVVDTQIYDHSELRIRSKISDLDQDDLKRRFVMNDIYLYSSEARKIALDRGMLAILQKLMGCRPILTQSLSFKWGTKQGAHQDTLYLPPPPDSESLVAIWVALEDIDLNSGPLFYIPKSHKIPKFYFSNGSLKYIQSELPIWESHINKYTNEMNLQSELFTAQKGDVLIWDGFLLHGGGDILDFSKTRKSFVCHYYSHASILPYKKDLKIYDNDESGCFISYNYNGLNIVKPW